MYFTLYTKIILKWITAPNVKATTTELFEESRGDNQYDLGVGNCFFDSTNHKFFLKR